MNILHTAARGCLAWGVH